jgi:hypothetical protein
MKFKTMEQVRDVIKKIIEHRLYIPNYTIGNNKFIIESVHVIKDGERKNCVFILFNKKDKNNLSLDATQHGNPVVMLQIDTVKCIDDIIETLTAMKKFMSDGENNGVSK